MFTIGNVRPIFVNIGWPDTTISILGLKTNGVSPKKREEEHISDKINNIKPNVGLTEPFSMIF